MRVVETLKTLVSPESSDDLIMFLRSFRDWVQFVVDQIWSEEKIPSMKTLHQRFYSVLRIHGFRAHHAKQIYKTAQSIVRSVKAGRGSKPVLRRLFARIDKYDYRLDLSNGSWS